VNTAAAIAFTLVMLTGLGGISWNAWNNQRATPEPVADDPLDALIWPATIWDHTVTALGDPHHINWEMPAPDWATT
jgi:hypothetical protein